MSHKNSLQTCKSGKDFIGYAETHGATVSRQNGSHVVLSTDKGSVVVPYHANRDLGTGLRHKIIKAFVALGLALVFVACVLSYAGIV